MTKIKEVITDIGEFLIKGLGICLVLAVILIAVYWLAENIYSMTSNHAFISANRLAYTTVYETKQVEVEVSHISREKGKDPVYTLTIDGKANATDVSETVYLEFIGDGNNAITVTIAKLEFCMATDQFGTSFDTAYFYDWTRRTYPWEEAPAEFSTQEILEAGRAIIESKGEPESVELSFEYDYTSSGRSFARDGLGDEWKMFNELTSA